MGSRESDDGVGGPWTDRGAGGDGLSGHPVMRVGDVDCALLVHDLDKRQLGNRIVKSVNQAPVPMPRQAGDVGSAVGFESLTNALSDCEPHRHPPWSHCSVAHILLWAHRGG